MVHHSIDKRNILKLFIYFLYHAIFLISVLFQHTHTPLFLLVGGQMKSQTLNPGYYVTIVKELIIIPQLPHL